MHHPEFDTQYQAHAAVETALEKAKAQVNELRDQIPRCDSLQDLENLEQSLEKIDVSPRTYYEASEEGHDDYAIVHPTDERKGPGFRYGDVVWVGDHGLAALIEQTQQELQKRKRELQPDPS